MPNLNFIEVLLASALSCNGMKIKAHISPSSQVNGTKGALTLLCQE
jgi:hypothetical protein